MSVSSPPDDCIEQAPTWGSLESALKWISASAGSGGWIIQGDDFFLATPGRFRTAPLFYVLDGEGGGEIADHPRAFLSEGDGHPIDTRAVEEFLHAGFVTGRRTLLKGIGQILPGEMLVSKVGMSRPELRRWFVYPQAEQYAPTAEAGRELVLGALRAAIDDITTWTAGRRMILPLTGGYDSRLLALLLAERGVSDVLCVTYDNGGRAWETRIARRLARTFGFRWRAVPHRPREARRWWLSQAFLDYQIWASGMAAMPHHQEWGTAVFAKSLEAERPSVVLSGICGGAVAGAFMPTEMARDEDLSLETVAHQAIRHFFVLRPSMTPDVFQRSLETVWGQMKELAETLQNATELFPAWEWQEREAKFIAGALRTYDWHGVPWAAPFIDGRVCDAWSRVPPHLRADRALHRQTVESMGKGLPAANLPEYRRSNTRIGLRLMHRIRSRTAADLKGAWEAGGGGLTNAAKMLHGDGWNADVALRRILASLPK